MIKIAFVIDTIESPTAGTEKQLLLLIRHLDRSRFTPYLCALRVSDWMRQHFNDCELIDMGVPSFSKLSSYANLVRFVSFLKRQRIDLVQTHFVDGNKVGVIAGRLAHVKGIISTRRNQGYWHNRMEIGILNMLNRWVTVFLANAEDTRQWVGKTEGVALDRVAVIHNALQTTDYRRASDELRLAFRAELAFPPDAVLVGIVANLRPVKAIDLFLRAAQLVAARCPLVRFVVVGEGPDRAPLEELSTNLGVAQVVRFLGKRLDIPEVLGCLDLGVLSSQSESFSNSIVEYLAAGLPVVCTDVGGAREAVFDGVNGFVVASGDHEAMAARIVDILDSGQLTVLGENGRREAEERFSLAAIMQRYERFYEGVLRS